jgi:hypothetical protein
MSNRLALRAPLLALLLSSSAWAASSNLLVNGILEKAAGATPASQSGIVSMSGSVNAAAITGWQITSGTVDLVPNSYWQTPTGTNFCVDLIGTPGLVAAGPTPALVQISTPSQLGQISQTVPTVEGNKYQLAFDMSVNPMTGELREYDTIKRLLVQAWSTNGESRPLLASREYDMARGTRHADNMQWKTDTQVDAHHQPFTFEADGSTLLTFTALLPSNLPSGANAANLYCGPAVANLRLTLLGGGNPVPEPTSLGLLGVGVSALLFKRRRGR